MSIEDKFDVPLISALALREKAIQQNFRPIIAVHKWFARRPGTLFRGLLLSEYAKAPLADRFFQSNDLSGLRIADPFMGGGTPLIEANRLGCDIVGWDINPMAWWIVGREIEHLDLEAYDRSAGSLVESLTGEIGSLYKTTCESCGGEASAKYFLWVKTIPCDHCATSIDLFPGYVVSKDARHPRNVLVCGACGELNEVVKRSSPGACSACDQPLSQDGPASRGAVRCPACEVENTYPRISNGPPAERMFAIEYHCETCKPGHRGRFFKKPDAVDLDRYSVAGARRASGQLPFVPDDRIPAGDESSRLHRWGYTRYQELFNDRQLLGLDLSCRLITKESNDRVRNALATNLSDLLRYNNMLVRYDTMALKALDVFSVHGFPAGLVRCEANLLGIVRDNGAVVGSGGWANVIKKFRTAKEFCDNPFEVAAGSTRRVFTTGEWIGDRPNGRAGSPRVVDLRCSSATEADLPPDSLDGVFTDPPYYDSVQYAELMDFCYVWLRRLAGDTSECLSPLTTRRAAELTGNATEGRDLVHFTDGLSEVFRRMSVALKANAPLVFTYHHNDLQAYYPVAVAILDAGLNCTATLPCPAEMGGSIHISGTGSSIVDSVFVCRDAGRESIGSLPEETGDVAQRVAMDTAQLEAGGVEPSTGDIRCLISGHLTRLAIGKLQDMWNATAATTDRLMCVEAAMRSIGSVDEIGDLLSTKGQPRRVHRQQDFFVSSNA